MFQNHFKLYNHRRHRRSMRKEPCRVGRFKYRFDQEASWIWYRIRCLEVRCIMDTSQSNTFFGTRSQSDLKWLSWLLALWLRKGKSALWARMTRVFSLLSTCHSDSCTISKFDHKQSSSWEKGDWLVSFVSLLFLLLLSILRQNSKNHCVLQVTRELSKSYLQPWVNWVKKRWVRCINLCFVNGPWHIAYGKSNFVTKQSVGVTCWRCLYTPARAWRANSRWFQIRRRRLARLTALGSPGAQGSAVPGASMPSPDALTPPPARLTPAPARPSDETTTPSDAANANKEPKYTEEVTKADVPKQNNIPSDGIIVTEKSDKNLLDEMPDTKMTDLSQTRQYNSFDSMGDDTLLSCGSVRVGNLIPSVVSAVEDPAQGDSTSRSMSPTQFAEPSPVRPRPTAASPSCSRRSLSMEVDDASERTSQSEQQQEPMDVSIFLIMGIG